MLHSQPVTALIFQKGFMGAEMMCYIVMHTALL